MPRAYERCTACDREIDPDRLVWLELDWLTGQYHPEGEVEADRSQGLFPFGRDCARSLIKKAKKATR